MNKTMALLTVAGLAGAVSQGADADLIAYWNFNDSPTATPAAVDLVVDDGVFGPSSPTPATITHTLTGTNGGATTNSYGSFGGTTINAVGADVAGRDFGIIGNGQNGTTVTFAVPTTGYEDIGFSFAQRITATGHDDSSFEWSTDGATWNLIDDDLAYTAAGTYETISFDLSGSTGLDNQSSVLFRFTLDGASSNNGSFRIDNVQINGSPLPEPASLALVGLGSVAMLRRRSA